MWKGEKILSPGLIDALARGDLGTPALRPKGNQSPLSAGGATANERGPICQRICSLVLARAIR
jgi:hypothetical protein